MNLPDDPRDTTTPEAMVRTMQRFLLSDEVLNGTARNRLTGWMVQSPTGRLRLRAGLPSTWRVGDKTGTWNGEHNATNDVAIAWPPSGAPFLIAAYLSDSTVDAGARSAAHAEIGVLSPRCGADMPWFRLFACGEDFPVIIDNNTEVVGFYTTRYIEAPTQGRGRSVVLRAPV